MHRFTTLSLFLVAFSVVTVSAFSGVFAYVNAIPKGEDILLRWRSSNEAGIHSYDIERNSEDVPEFRRLGRVSARGAGNTYTFVDNGAFFKPQGGKKFTYRVRAIGTGTEQYSPVTTVVHEVSSVRRSWGMIKELFR